MLPSLRNRVKSPQLSRVELSFLLLLLVFGVPMILLIPPGAGYDEEDHLVRVWELSSLSFIPGQMPPQELRYPTVFRDVMYRQQGSTGIIDSEFWQSYRDMALDTRGVVRREINTKSVYSPALLIPQALAMGVFARAAELPVLPAFYLSRFAGLLSYLCLTWIAIRLLPFGKWILLALAVSPAALFQATTLTPDAISNGIGFLFIAGILRTSNVQEIGWREVWGLILLVFLLFFAKLNLLVLILLLFLLIPPSRFTEKRLYIFLLTAMLILFLIEVAGWNWIASRNFDSLLLDEADPKAQVLYILRHPFAFLQAMWKDFIANGLLYVQGWINGYGYYYWTPPWIVSFFFVISLLAAVFIDSTSQVIDKNLRIGFLFLFAAGYLATVAAMYVSFAAVGSDTIAGVQGRYFIPVALPLFLVFSSISWKRNFPIPSRLWISGILAITLFLNLLGLFFSFHVPCGSTFYQTGLCYRPLFRDLSGEVRTSPPVSGDTVLTQQFRVACNGLAEVRVLLTPSATEDHGIACFIILDAVSEQPLLDKSIANGPIREETWYSLPLETDWFSEGKEYILEILGTSPFPDQGLQFLYTPQPEFDLGDFYENGELLEEDLVLQYGCTAGLRKIWLAGKP